MRVKEQEQIVIQKIARRREKYYKGIMRESGKENFFELSARAAEIKDILDEIMGIKIMGEVKKDGKELYIKGCKIKHIRNFNKRK